MPTATHDLLNAPPSRERTTRTASRTGSRSSTSIKPPSSLPLPEPAKPPSTTMPNGRRRERTWPSIGTKNSIPEEMDHREIGVRMPMMDEVQLLLASEPCKPSQPRTLHMVFLVE